MNSPHKFHIPVMGIGFTIDSPLKVAQFGIDSTIFISDDILLEKMRKMYCEKHNISYEHIDAKAEDSRAKRTTAYLDLIQDLIAVQLEQIYKGDVKLRDKYFDMLPDDSPLKNDYLTFIAKDPSDAVLGDWLKANLVSGHVDVNIMTKLDKENFIKKEKLPVEYNDAHAALRGFALSKVDGSMVFSAGMNPRLFSYTENFDDFYPDVNGKIRKRIILKVSDYRSALIQGKFLAKKGLWVSEFRIESGLNCGGHAFATEGHLMGPILEEFRSSRQELKETLKEIVNTALSNKDRVVPIDFDLRITAQGGVGTQEEQDFLLSHYGLDSVGWGSPFLLVPEATSVDQGTMDKLALAKEKDLYLSNISPLGVPFNNLKGNTKDLHRLSLIAKGRPGSSCPKKFLALNKEFTEEAICTASRQYQHLKLEKLKDELSKEAYEEEFGKVVESSCLCVGLGTTAMITHDIDRKVEGDGVLVCPGPNMAYFSEQVSLKKMVNHIYGRKDIMTRKDRPQMFVKELGLYVDFLKKKSSKGLGAMNKKEKKGLISFVQNMRNGINYYNELFSEVEDRFVNYKEEIFTQLRFFWMEVDNIEEVILADGAEEKVLVVGQG
ncbi:MAG: hypothetical protein OCD76_04870 [Reichenbachiella sp.]